MEIDVTIKKKNGETEFIRYNSQTGTEKHSKKQCKDKEKSHSKKTDK